jgi:hypothetical protein
MADDAKLMMEQRAEVVVLFAETKSVIATQRKFPGRFSTRWAPARNTILHLYRQV